MPVLKAPNGSEQRHRNLRRRSLRQKGVKGGRGYAVAGFQASRDHYPRHLFGIGVELTRQERKIAVMLVLAHVLER